MSALQACAIYVYSNSNTYALSTIFIMCSFDASVGRVKNTGESITSKNVNNITNKESK